MKGLFVVTLRSHYHYLPVASHFRQYLHQRSGIGAPCLKPEELWKGEDVLDSSGDNLAAQSNERPCDGEEDLDAE